MRRAFALAREGLGLAAPNPLVGAVVVRDGAIVGEGWHEGPGTPHAEVHALAAAGPNARGATLYVTLEPCSHQGRTPPCAPKVREAGIARVVAAIRDPNPVVDGRGLALLAGGGLDVVDGVLADEAMVQNAGFFKHIRVGIPFVTLKMAASLDGKVAACDGSSRWITGEEARRDVHRLRAESGAVVVGAGTAAADDPSLTVRLDGYRGRQPLRVLVDGRGRVPARGALFDGTAPTLVATTAAVPERAVRAWRAAGAEVLVQERDGETVSVSGVMESLGKRGVVSALIEGGPTLAWSAVAEGAVDRFVLYVAPKLIGGSEAPGVLGGTGVAGIGDAVPGQIESVDRLGPDLRITASLRPADQRAGRSPWVGTGER
jgi:diaminohydroxyphosphoribosylaminopyrimidine deaminase/5-amino-6-(5-phosphoribosylamino)uracil reductase